MKRPWRRTVHLTLWSFVSLAVVGILAVGTNKPFIFPSLGPSILMIFGRPLGRQSRLRNVMSGHAAGALCGYAAVWATGLLGVPYSADISFQRVLAAATALALTAFTMRMTKLEHAPAGATTLIVAFGLLPKLMDFVWLMAAVLLIVILGGAARAIGRFYELRAKTAP